MQKCLHFLRANKIFLGTLLFLFFYSAGITLAVPPTTKYQPGETLDPNCAPGAINCSVEILPSQTGNSGKFLTTDGTSVSWSSVSSGIDGSGAANRVAYWSDADTLTSSASFTFNGTTFAADSAATFNDSGADADFRIEGDTEANLFFVDASADRIGIGTNAPSYTLDLGSITGSTVRAANYIGTAFKESTGNSVFEFNSSRQIVFNTAGSVTAPVLSFLGDADTGIYSSLPNTLAIAAGGTQYGSFGFFGTVFNDSGNDINFRVEGDTDSNLLVVDAGLDYVGIGTASPNSKLDVNGVLTVRDDINFAVDTSGGGYVLETLDQTQSNTGANGITIQTGSGNGTGAGGNLIMLAGDSGLSGAGGGVEIYGGFGEAGNGGSISMVAGYSNVAGGSISFQSGDGDSGNGGNINFIGGGTTDGNGGTISFTAGGSNNAAGGGITLRLGDGNGSNDGNLVVAGTGDIFNLLYNGNLGLGDDSPDDLLNIHSGSAAAGLAITSLGTDTDPYIKFELADGTSTFTMGVDDSDSDKFKISTTALGTNDRLVITSSGEVGIGDSSPAALFTVGSGDLFQINSSGITLGPNGGSGAPAYSFTADTDSGMYRDTDGIKIVKDGNVVLDARSNTLFVYQTMLPVSDATISFGQYNNRWNNFYATRFVPTYGSESDPPYNFQDGANNISNSGMFAGSGFVGFTVDGDEKIRIETSGEVGIGNSSPGVLLHVGSASATDGSTLLRLQDANSTCNFTADSGAPTCGSDRTLKKDIASLDTADLLERVAALNPVSYQWKTDHGGAPVQYGFIAQEVEEQFPDLVTENTWIDGSTKKFLSIGGMVPYVVGAVKELNLKMSEFDPLQSNEGNSFLADGTVADNFTEKVRLSFVKLSGVFIDMKLWVQELTAKKVTTSELCIDEVCITKEQLQELLNEQTESSTPPPAEAPEEEEENIPPVDGSTGDEEILENDPTEEDPITTDINQEPAPVNETDQNDSSSGEEIKDGDEVSDTAQSANEPIPDAPLEEAQ